MAAAAVVVLAAAGVVATLAASDSDRAEMPAQPVSDHSADSSGFELAVSPIEGEQGEAASAPEKTASQDGETNTGKHERPRKRRKSKGRDSGKMNIFFDDLSAKTRTRRKRAERFFDRLER